MKTMKCFTDDYLSFDYFLATLFQRQILLLVHVFKRRVGAYSHHGCRSSQHSCPFSASSQNVELTSSLPRSCRWLLLKSLVSTWAHWKNIDFDCEVLVEEAALSDIMKGQRVLDVRKFKKSAVIAVTVPGRPDQRHFWWLEEHVLSNGRY